MAKQESRIEKNLSRNEFYSRYFNTKTPVLIKGMFDDQPISDVRTEENVIKQFGNCVFETLEEYVSKFQRDDSFVQSPQFWTLRQYIEYSRDNPDTKLCVREYNTPPEVLAFFRVPDLVSVREGSEVTSNLFLANKSNAAQMHFDGDHRHVFLHQIFGRKRAFVVPASSSFKMLTVLNQCWHDIAAMSETEKQKFIEYVDGYEFMLEPGDTLYFPMMAWHHLEYIDTGMSVNFRFGRSAYNTQLYKFMHADKYVQNVASILDYDAPKKVDRDAIFERILAALKQFEPNPNVKFRQIRDLMKDIYGDISQLSHFNEYLLGGENEIIENSRALRALTAQPYHISNWLRLNDLYEPLHAVIADIKAADSARLITPKGVTANL